MIDSSYGHAILGRQGAAAFAFAQTVELDQTSGLRSSAQHYQGDRPSRYEKQHLPCIKGQEPCDLIVAELSFNVQFVA
jgi:hypothetical protein